MSDGGGGQQTATKEPWAEAAPWLKQNIQTGQNLQQYYQQNPFNQLQQTGYQNLFSDLDSFRNQMAPGLMQFANQAMNSSYQRPQYSRPGAAGYGQQQAQQQAAQTGQFSVAEPQQQKQYGGLLGFGKTSPVSQSYGLLDFQAMNPYNGALKPAEITQPTQQTVEEAVRAELERRQKEAANQYDRFA